MMTEQEFSDGCRRELAGRLGVRVESLEEKAARLGALPPPSPALILHQAAAVLRERVAKARTEAASNDYWDMGWARGVENAIGGPAGVLAGMFTPDMAAEMADWLDATAAEAVRYARGFGNLQEEITDGYPIRMARRILGEAS